MGISRAKSLGEILKLDLVANETPTKVTELWNAFHALNPQTVSKAVKASHHSVIRKNLEAAPKFTYPILRQEGQFMVISVFTENAVKFHHIADYGTDPMHSQPYLVVSFFEELVAMKSKRNVGLALYRGDIVKQDISKFEAEKLLRGLLSFYLRPTLYDYVVLFNHSPEKFQHEDFLKLYLDEFA